jgi:transcriptional regulator with XRE-family HTH domain
MLRRSRQSVHSLTTRDSVSGGDPAAAELVTQALLLLWELSESTSTTAKRLPPRRATHALPGLVGRRLRAGLAQAELAARAGISRETLLRLEHGHRGTTESVARLAGALMVPIRVLTRDPEFDRHVTARFRTCSTCHQLKRVTSLRRSREVGATTVDVERVVRKPRSSATTSTRRRDLPTSSEPGEIGAENKILLPSLASIGRIRTPARSGPDCLGHPLSVSPRTPCRRIANGDDPLRESGSRDTVRLPCRLSWGST